MPRPPRPGLLLLCLALAGCQCGPAHPAFSEGGGGGFGGGAGGGSGGGSSGGGCAGQCGSPGCGTCPPRGDVEVGDYAIDATEVTNAAYAAWLALRPDPAAQQAPCDGNARFTPTSSWPPDAGEGDLPVVGVDWCDAQAYCAWQGKHLCGRRGGGSLIATDFTNPARSEWFAVCSDQGARTYPYGSSFDAGVCNTLGAGVEARWAAGSGTDCRGPEPVYDLSGNVWEWEDACDGAGRCHLRGGSFHDGASVVRCDIDNVLERLGTLPDLGFRCCRSL